MEFPFPPLPLSAFSAQPPPRPPLFSLPRLRPSRPTPPPLPLPLPLSLADKWGPFVSSFPHLPQPSPFSLAQEATPGANVPRSHVLPLLLFPLCALASVIEHLCQAAPAVPVLSLFHPALHCSVATKERRHDPPRTNRPIRASSQFLSRSELSFHPAFF